MRFNSFESTFCLFRSCVIFCVKTSSERTSGVGVFILRINHSHGQSKITTVV